MLIIKLQECYIAYMLNERRRTLTSFNKKSKSKFLLSKMSSFIPGIKLFGLNKEVCIPAMKLQNALARPALGMSAIAIYIAI